MNEDHAALCASPEWAEHLAEEVLPAALDGVRLGDDVLEVGPGYGASTEWLVRRTDNLTVVELDAALAADLGQRLSTVEVVHGDGSELPFAAGRFSAVVCFTMLHHVGSAAAQGELFAEVARVLSPDGTFAGSDSIADDGLREFHAGDTYVPVDPDTLPDRLAAVGFADAQVVRHEHWFTFTATTAALGAPPPRRGREA